MAALALENLLQDFGRVTRATDRGSEPATLAALVSTRSEPPLTQEMLDAAIAKAEAVLRDRMTAEHEAAMTLETQRHAGETAELNARLGEQSGTMIAERMREMEETVTALAASAAARILALHLTAEIQQRMIEELGQAIRDALGDSDAVRIRVRGPLSLYEALIASIGDLSKHVEYTELPGFDLSASIDDSLFETRLADWADALAEVLT